MSCCNTKYAERKKSHFRCFLKGKFNVKEVAQKENLKEKASKYKEKTGFRYVNRQNRKRLIRLTQRQRRATTYTESEVIPLYQR